MRSISLLPWLVLAPATIAQDYRSEQIDEIGVKYQVFKKLERIPLRLGDSSPHLKAQYEPGGPGDYISGSLGAFPWYLWVYVFPKTAEAVATGADSKSPSEAVEKKIEARRRAANFKDFVTSDSKDSRYHGRKFVLKEKEVVGKGKKVTYFLWEYTDVHAMTNRVENFDQPYYSMAAAYDFPDRQVALVCEVPLKKNATKPTPNHLDWMRTMVLSLQPLKENEVEEDETDAKKDRHADTDTKRKALAAAKENIRNLGSWDYFTMPHYICIYSWDGGPQAIDKQREQQKKARTLVDQMERMHAFYEKHYPPHDKMADYYSVVRICGTADDYNKYSDGALNDGAVGWFSPRSKELVFFLGGEKFGLGKQFTANVAFHEGWHQYLDRLLNLPITAEPHRWFDEGTGEWFGSFSWNNGTWSYTINKNRAPEVKEFVRAGNHVPWKEIVNWNKDKFYGNRKSAYYAQAYSMVDFLRFGMKNKSDWDPAWEKILDTYSNTLRETQDAKKAVEKAFAGVDWDKIEASWLKWVKVW